MHKTLFNIEGLGRELYPELDLWKTAQPVLRAWMDEQVGPRALASDLRENLPQVRQAFRQLPAAIRQLSEQASTGHIRLDMQSEEMQEIRKELASQRRQRYWLTLAATGLIAGTVLISLDVNVYVGVALLALGAGAVFMSRTRS